MKNIGIFGSCQIFNSKFFLNNNLLTNTDLNIKFCLQFYQYDEKIMCGYRGILDYNIFNRVCIFRTIKPYLNTFAMRVT